MKVNMINEATNTIVIGVEYKFVKKWIELGFKIKSFESDKIHMLKVV